ncbi:MAG: hypothetical protein ACTHJ0_01005 [Flavipsychrobacter sp.]
MEIAAKPLAANLIMLSNIYQNVPKCRIYRTWEILGISQLLIAPLFPLFSGTENNNMSHQSGAAIQISAGRKIPIPEI